MRFRNQGFALVLVLIAVAAIFGLAMQTGAVMRTTSIEVAAVHNMDIAHREARSASVLALAGLYTIDESASFGSEDGSGGSGSEDGGDDEPDFELPDFIRDILEESGKLQEFEAERDEREEQAAASEGAGGLGGRAGRSSEVEILKVAGLPARPVQVPMGDHIYRVHLTDAMGRIDLNSVTETQFRRFLSAHKVSESTAEAITSQLLDWRDDDDFRRRNGAEADTYRRRGMEPRNGPIRSVEELLFLPAMTDDIFFQIRPQVALAGDNVIHAGTAPAEVMMSLPGITREVADTIIKQRTKAPLTLESLEGLLPIAARESKTQFRVDPSNYIRLHVAQLDSNGEPGRAFEGIALFTKDGLKAIGLRRH